MILACIMPEISGTNRLLHCCAVRHQRLEALSVPDISGMIHLGSYGRCSRCTSLLDGLRHLIPSTVRHPTVAKDALGNPRWRIVVNTRVPDDWLLPHRRGAFRLPVWELLTGI